MARRLVIAQLLWLPSWHLGARFRGARRVIPQWLLDNRVPGWAHATLEKRRRLVGLFLHGTGKVAFQRRAVTPERRRTDVDDDDVAAEVDHLTAGDEGGVVIPRHLT